MSFPRISQPSPPTSTSTSTPPNANPRCGCLAATLTRLIALDDTDNSISAPSDIPNPPPVSPPSRALLQGRLLTAHWAHLSHTCPNSSLHVSSPAMLRLMTTAVDSLSLKYSAHLSQWLNHGMAPQPTPTQVVQEAAGQGQGHIGIYRLEQDETQILLQEALRASIEELSRLVSGIQSRVRDITRESAAAAMANGPWPVSGTSDTGINRMANYSGQGSYLNVEGASDDLGLGLSADQINALEGFDIEMDMDMDLDMGDNPEFQNGAAAREESARNPSMDLELLTPPTDDELSKINMRLWTSLRELDLLESDSGRDPGDINLYRNM